MAEFVFGRTVIGQSSYIDEVKTRYTITICAFLEIWVSEASQTFKPHLLWLSDLHTKLDRLRFT